MNWTGARVLRDRNAALYLGGVVTSAFGDSAMSLAAGVWVKTLTGSDSLAALVTFCFWLPVLAGPAIGVLADRFPHRPLLAAANLALAAALTLPLAVESARQVWLLFAVLVVVGAGSVLTGAAGTALCATVVPAELRGDLNGLARTAVESGKLCAPLAGAALFTALGGKAVALLDCATFLLAAAAFTLIRVRHAGMPGADGPPGRPPPSGPSAPFATPLAHRRSWTRETAEGIRYLWRHGVLRTLVLAGSAALVVSGVSSTATYALLDDGLHRSPAYAGVLTTAQGLGSVVSGLAAGALLRRMPERAFAATGLAVFALGSLARAAPWPTVVVAGSVLIGTGLPCPLVAASTAVQRETPAGLRGRVAATADTLMFAPTGLALLLGTAMVAVLDYRVQVLAAGALALAAVAGVLLPGSGTEHRGRKAGANAGAAARPGSSAPDSHEDKGGSRADD
ncbi:MFS transporter [Streptomyces marispadix]|uniref:MFS transporter n=1 Tax=Streptomyces marispadix TaxID=2922868 RepID=A0ABS9T5M1_9ACTN|nr:MFS transporter [Streptomyces marispadix]MCH6163753.1 MFS transporter [Streptomyces marispadix]